jgi:tetratricopeptide (TPR) repeat protein
MNASSRFYRLGSLGFGLKRHLRLIGALAGLLAAHPILRAHSIDPALYPSMIQTFTEELAKSPEPDLYIERGQIFGHLKEWKKADADFAAAARLDPQRIVLNLLRGRALLEGGEPHNARPLLDRYLEQKSSQPEPWFLRGQILAAMGKTALARADYLEGFRRAPEAKLEQVLEWSRLFAALPGVDLAEVLSILDAAVARLGAFAPLVEYAINLEIGRQNYEAALARIDRALPQSRWQAPLLALRGDVLARTGQRPGAASAYRAALAAIEKLPERNRMIADVQKLARDTRDAIARLSL